MQKLHFFLTLGLIARNREEYGILEAERTLSDESVVLSRLLFDHWGLLPDFADCLLCSGVVFGKKTLHSSVNDVLSFFGVFIVILISIIRPRLRGVSRSLEKRGHGRI